MEYSSFPGRRLRSEYLGWKLWSNILHSQEGWYDLLVSQEERYYRNIQVSQKESYDFDMLVSQDVSYYRNVLVSQEESYDMTVVIMFQRAMTSLKIKSYQKKLWWIRASRSLRPLPFSVLWHFQFRYCHWKFRQLWKSFLWNLITKKFCYAETFSSVNLLPNNLRITSLLRLVI